MPDDKRRQLLAQSNLLDAAAARLADLHDAAAGSEGIVSAALAQLSPCCAAAAVDASSDLKAVAVAAMRWASAIDGVISLGQKAADPDVTMLQHVRADIGQLIAAAPPGRRPGQAVVRGVWGARR